MEQLVARRTHNPEVAGSSPAAAMTTLDADDLELLAEARRRLDWIRDEYGEDDIDYQTFAPIVALLVEATVTT